MAMSKNKVGDNVRVMTGKRKGHEGRVIAIDRKKGIVTVEGANIVTKHTKPSMTNQNGGIVQQEAAMDISNVMLVVDGQVTRVGFSGEGKSKVRVAKKTGKVVE